MTSTPLRQAATDCFQQDQQALAEQMSLCASAHRLRWQAFSGSLRAFAGAHGMTLAVVLVAGAWLLS